MTTTPDVVHDVGRWPPRTQRSGVTREIFVCARQPIYKTLLVILKRKDKTAGDALPACSKLHSRRVCADGGDG
ncbi:hypothetical protein EVAR_86041_1 [Eumeta japonica]|uniref:Uncharacterized protein n=1 Tax=Eumeta variegata TaxID=151549 RepID=A0A4C1UJN9_EUMVA|nr:hypothetical protein EVAR_86041_1 [Eumeta japonica]